MFYSAAFKSILFRLSISEIERTISISRLSKAFKLISLYNLHPRTKELCWRLLDSRLLAKTAKCLEDDATLGAKNNLTRNLIMRKETTIILKETVDSRSQT